MSEIDWHHFAAVDIRVGTVIKCMPFKEAIKPAYILQVDFGELGVLKSSAQITDFYQVDDLIGTQVIAVVNFPPKQIATIKSQCLILGAVQNDGVVLLRPDKPTDNGIKVS